MLTVPVEQPVDPVRSSLYCLFTGAVLLLVQLGRPDLQNGFCEGSSHHLGKPDSMQVGTSLDQVRTGPAVSHGKPLVVLLHGLMRGRKSMEKLRRQIQQDTGWTAVSLQYPSTRQPIIKLAEGVASEVHELVSQGGHTSVWAVTHSLGGVLQRHIMGLPNQGGIVWSGIVMIAPPNQGSTVAHQMSGLPGIGKLFQLLYGSAGVELGAEMAEGNVWPDPPQPCGIIAGTQALALANPTSWMTSVFHMIPGVNDGTVALEETKLSTGFQTDCIKLHLPHTTIATSPEVAPLVIQFLKHGKFTELGSAQRF